jgi:hypothetical protein
MFGRPLGARAEGADGLVLTDPAGAGRLVGLPPPQPAGTENASVMSATASVRLQTGTEGRLRADCNTTSREVADCLTATI